MEQNEQVCLQIRDLSKQFTIYNNGKTIYACQHVNLTLNQGEFIGITGKSGSGKSTILKGIYRTNLPQAGEIWYASEKYGWIDLCQATERQILYLRRYEIGYVSQFLQLMPRTTARQIVENAGLDGSVIIDKVRSEKPGFGFNALTEEYVNMVDNGILDPAKVTRSALQNATSVASTLLTTESVVANIKEDAPAMPAGGAGGMGMM